MGTHWIALQLNGNNVTYLDNFAFEHIPKQVKKLKDKKNNKNKNLPCTSKWFINAWIILYWSYWFYAKSLLDYTNLFSPNKYEKNYKLILEYFQWLKTKKWFY